MRGCLVGVVSYFAGLFRVSLTDDSVESASKSFESIDDNSTVNFTTFVFVQDV